MWVAVSCPAPCSSEVREGHDSSVLRTALDQPLRNEDPSPLVRVSVSWCACRLSLKRRSLNDMALNAPRRINAICADLGLSQRILLSPKTALRARGRRLLESGTKPSFACGGSKGLFLHEQTFNAQPDRHRRLSKTRPSARRVVADPPVAINTLPPAARAA